MKGRPYTPNPSLVAAFSLAPLVGASSTFAAGSIMGLIMALGALAARGGAGLARARLPGRLAAATQLVLLGAYASLCWILVELWSPPVAAAIGLYLPLVAVGSFVTHEMRRRGGEGEASLSRSLLAALGYLLAALLLSALREIGGRGSLSLPLPGSSLPVISLLPGGALPILLTPPGALLLLALLAALDRLIFPLGRGREDER